ncbi:TetR family transcriptional regulator [Nocardioides lijunqiniae]|uniref:TetR family transcriptional regulator n=1 Tax=Nocardioides lijunqiniae TaxID=2760832 RepID=UPI001877EE3D|nr:TetR family transcriptional regulator [Nocardioides lijunqiniae]
MTADGPTATTPGTTTSGAMTLRDHARGAVRDEVMRCAWLLFLEHGFEGTTVDQIAEAAGMSRRTFFRYFAGKEELVLERLVESGQSIADELAARPAAEGAWSALRAAFETIVVLQEQHPEQARPLLVMLRTEPALRGSVLERRRRWQDVLAPLVAARLPRARGAATGVRASAVTGSALACLEAAQDHWTDHPGTSLPRLLDQAMAAVAPL